MCVSLEKRPTGPSGVARFGHGCVPQKAWCMKESEDNKKSSFWTDKTPCWVIRGCVVEARHRCNAYLNPSVPCWKQETLCKQFFDFCTCFTCDVFNRYCGRLEEIENGSRDPGAK